ncbi:MAG: ribulose-phosphate 3-epimerase, partial [bacterium]
VVSMAHVTVKSPLNVHLMMNNPEAYAERFIQAGAATLLIHAEIAGDRRALLRRIRGWGARAGITLNPETPLAALDGLLDEVDEVLCMTVHPGYGGQSFIAGVLPKIAGLRAAIRASGQAIDLSVDGGVDIETAVAAARAGANLLIAGTSLYRSQNMAADVQAMRKVCEAAWQTSNL